FRQAIRTALRLIPARSLAVRVLAVLSAACLVGAVALATILPPTLSLGQLLARIDHSALVAMQNWTGQHLSEWVWAQLALPLLVRPDWLLPVALGLVLGGAALTLGSRHGAAQRRRG
ncbi:MAG TPA: hypothetical protein VGC80_03145, partial [Acetobacteraceae bacterium]